MPGKQPGDLPSKVPGEKEKAAALNERDALAAQASQINPEDISQVRDQSFETLGTDELTNVLSQPADAQQETRDVVNQLALSDASLEVGRELDDDLLPGEKEIKDPLQQELEKSTERPLSFPEEFAIRAVQNLGRNIREEKSLTQKAFQKFLGPGFEIRSKGNEIFFRKKGSKKFHRLDPEGLEGGFRELILDTFADFSGEQLETAAGVGAVAIGGAAGAAIGGPLGAVGGAIAAAPVAGLAQTAARQMAIEAFQAETSTDLEEEFQMNTGLNLVTLGAGALLKGAGKRALNFLKEAFETAPEIRIKKLAEIRQSYEQVVNDIGRPTRTRGEIGKEIEDSITTQNNLLDKKVRLVKEESIARAVGPDGQPTVFDPPKFIERLQGVMDELGITRETQDALAREASSDVTSFTARNKVLAELKAQKVLGDESGMSFAKEVINSFGQVSKKGGLTAKEMFNQLDFWKKPSGFKAGTKFQFPKASQALSRRIRQGLTVDRSTMIEGLFKNDPKRAGFLRSAFSDYAGKIDQINKFKKLVNTKESAEKFVESIVEPKKAERIRQFKSIVGEGSTEMGNVQAIWVDNMFKKTVDPVTGTVNGRALSKEMDRWGEDVVREMLTKQQAAGLKDLAKRAEKIPFMDMMSKTDQQLAQDIAATTIFQYPQPTLITRMLWNMFRGNAAASKFLKNEGLLNIAVDPSKPLQRSKILKVIESYSRLLDATDVVRVKNRNILKQMDLDKKIRDPKIRKIILDTQKRIAPDEGLPAIPGAQALGTGELIQAGVREGEAAE